MKMENNSKLFIGTCSWKYDSWKGLIYPDKEKFNHLQVYSKHFNTVEIDQWFWSLHSEDKISLPRSKDVLQYSESVPDDFKFSIKVPNSITLTHFYRRKKTDELRINPFFLNNELFEKFLMTLEPMKNKLGPLMFQFEYLNREKMSSQVEFMERFESFIETADRNFNYAIEIRNPNYINKKYFEFLNQNNLNMVFLHGYYMQPVWDSFNNFKELIKDTVVLRLHGPDRKGIESKTGGDWSKIVESKENEIPKITTIIQFLLMNEVDVFVNVNNHYEGSAPLTIKKIQQQLLLE